ncbi:MAG: septal ring lytic transglycosylase RlpA family protein, partial [Nitrospirales bacterium]
MALYAVLVWMGGCAGSETSRLRSDDRSGYTERGMASWYGPKFHGRLTANGERYDQYAFTAAHRTLPMGSVVVVTSLTNGRRVRVRINDRGPFVRGRIIDLSRSAAEHLGMLTKGVDEVEVRLEGFSGPPGAAGYLRVQVASFAERENAQLLAARLRAQYP